MKNLLRYLLLLLFSVLLFSIMGYSAFAHPGNTDSSGGHTDHSTGDYHYHHGYSAHEHYDMDGDGIIDCPYDFNDRTNSGGNRSTNDDTDTWNYRVTPTSPHVTEEPSVEKKYEEESSVPIWVYWLIAGLTASLLICLYVINRKNLELQETRAEFKSYAAKTRELFAASTVSSYSRAIKQAAENNRQSIESLPPTAMINFRDPFPLNYYEEFDNKSYPFDLPHGVTITQTGEAALGYIYDKRPFGKYTVFISQSGKCYHSPYCNCAMYSRPACIFTAMQYYVPCSHCKPDSPDSIPEWYLNFRRASRDFGIDWRNRKQQQ